jgi:tRNA G26 N,N-dimethylase Trm1
MTKRRPGYSREIGFINDNGQRVVRNTNQRGTDHMQVIDVLHCEHCGHEYGANSSDNWQRKCPACQNGAAGLDYV